MKDNMSDKPFNVLLNSIIQIVKDSEIKDEAAKTLSYELHLSIWTALYHMIVLAKNTRVKCIESLGAVELQFCDDIFFSLVRSNSGIKVE